jgi:lipopolysaccharide/colanic/teichoic acid biosynthesis glycosyltransferase
MPLMVGITLLLATASPDPVFFRQRRLGKNGQPFQLLKFRTMQNCGQVSGCGLTSPNDSRVTRLGRYLRRWKLDELPQLINVLKGEMSLVGPRPDLPEIWNRTGATERSVLALKPGLTGAASLVFRREEQFLAQAPTGQLMEFYLNAVLPRKARLDLEYAAHASFWSDLLILFQTACPALRLKVSPPELIPLNEQISRQ